MKSNAVNFENVRRGVSFKKFWDFVNKDSLFRKHSSGRHNWISSNRSRFSLVVLVIAISVSQIWTKCPSVVSSLLRNVLNDIEAKPHIAREGVNSRLDLPELIDADLDHLEIGLRSFRFTSVDLVKAYTARIQEVNHALRIVTEVNPEAVDIALRLDEERRRGQVRGSLHGIPILLKDNIATADEMSTSAGSFAIVNARPPYDATVVKKLREAGAIILGKSNLSQWGNERSLNSSNGWSARGGQCHAAYFPKQDPGGSSSGSGVAASLGLAPVTLGTETAGSIIIPADRSNVVGIKPTVGLTSRFLVVPISSRADTVGPIAKTVKDAAIVLQAIAGSDPADNYTNAVPYAAGQMPDYVAACVTTGLIDKRIGVPRNLLFAEPADEPIIAAFNAALEEIQSLGATVIDNANVSEFAAHEMQHGDSLFTMINADFKTDLPEKYLSLLIDNPHNITCLEQLKNYTEGDPREQWPSRDTGRWEDVLGLKFNNTSAEYWNLVQSNQEIGGPRGILGAISYHNLDAVVLPSVFVHKPAAYMGTPVVTVPLGFYPSLTKVEFTAPREELVRRAPGIPYGLSFLGPAWSESDLISFAFAYEQRTLTRRRGRPYLIPSTELRDILGS